MNGYENYIVDRGSQGGSGKKTFGYLKIGETPAALIQLPIGIINGTDEGPRLCIIAGTHPCEYTGIDATCSR